MNLLFDAFQVQTYINNLLIITAFVPELHKQATSDPADNSIAKPIILLYLTISQEDFVAPWIVRVIKDAMPIKRILHLYSLDLFINVHTYNLTFLIDRDDTSHDSK